MANSLNKVMLMGNLTRDVELRAVGGGGQQVAKIGLALNRSFTTQSGEKQFDWESKITMKWGLNDLGAVLATLQGRQEQAKLFHQSEKANSAFELTYRDDPQKAPFFMSMSRQEGATKNVKKVTIPVTHAEAAILETALRAAITRLIGW